MTPQLQQAIRLLQLSTLDLSQEIQQALDSNPLLESEENYAQHTKVNGEDYQSKEPSDSPESHKQNNDINNEREIQADSDQVSPVWKMNGRSNFSASCMYGRYAASAGP